MKSTTIRRTLTASLTGPLVAAGIILGSMVIGEAATANAQPTDGQCTSMPMTDGQDTTAPNALTRAGQVGAATAGSSASDGSMPANCAPASHG